MTHACISPLNLLSYLSFLATLNLKKQIWTLYLIMSHNGDLEWQHPETLFLKIEYHLGSNCHGRLIFFFFFMSAVLTPLYYLIAIVRGTKENVFLRHQPLCYDGRKQTLCLCYCDKHHHMCYQGDAGRSERATFVTLATTDWRLISPQSTSILLVSG